MEWRKLAVPLLTVLVLSILGVWLVTYFYPPERKQLGIELAKALIQIATVLILGQLVSMWIEDARYKRQKGDEQKEREHQQTEAVNDFRKEVLYKLIETYSEAKKIRRLLRAQCFIPVSNSQQQNAAKVHRDIYDKQMQNVNEVQLGLEAIKQEINTSIETSSGVFSSPGLLKSHVDSMESYLRKIVKEYEENLRYFEGDPPALALSKLKKLGEFVGPSDASEFNIEFVVKYHLALSSVRGDILTATTRIQDSITGAPNV